MFGSVMPSVVERRLRIWCMSELSMSGSFWLLLCHVVCLTETAPRSMYSLGFEERQGSTE